jgi:Undecaprenyl-phosphate galactose phosphotransferase WbaP
MITENLVTQIETEDVKIQRTIFNVHSRQWMGYILFATDMLSLLIAMFIAVQVRSTLFTTIHLPYLGIFLLLGGTIAYLFVRRGLYPPVGMHYADELRHIVTTVTLAFLIMIGVTFVFKSTLTYSHLVLTLTWILCLPFIPFGRYIVRRLFIYLGFWGESVLIVGDPQKARTLAEYFKIRLQYGILPVAVLSDKLHSDEAMAPCPILPLCRIKLLARNLSVKTVLLVIDDFNNLEQVVARYRAAFQWMILVKDKYENYGLTFLKPLDFLEAFGLQVKNNLMSNSMRLPKRVLDVFLTILGLLFLAPFLILIAIMIKGESGGDVFYRQRRLGKNGQVFNLVKFRSMHKNADAILKDALARDPELRMEWNKYQKLRNDPRITRMGRFLRRFSLDELPQLWNVLKGEMSLVGPRPMMVNQQKLYGDSFTAYIQVSPGITGLWQVSGRNQTTFARRAQLDLEYIQRWSVWLDIYVLLKTFKVVIWQEGAY